MRILIVEDDQLVQQSIKHVFKDHKAVCVEAGEEALELIANDSCFNLVFLDIRLAGQLSGVEVLKAIRICQPALPIVIMSGLEDRKTIMECLELGAVDYLVKGSVNPSAYMFAVHKASVWRSKQAEALGASSFDEAAFEDAFEQIVGTSHEMVSLREELRIKGKFEGSFLVIGETGTGKELVARALWAAKGDKSRPYITVNCAALQPSTIEGELFGFEKGAFTGALDRRIGLFEAADGGDIFLDEIGELPLEMQAKLLRVIQERKIRRMGSNKEIQLNFRVIAATNRNLIQEVEAGRFRADLYYRLDMHKFTLSPLRARPQDIVRIFTHYLAKDGIENVSISESVRQKIETFDWPGNGRQLIAFGKFITPMIDPVNPTITDKAWQAWTEKSELYIASVDNFSSSKEQIIKALKTGNFDIDRDYEERRRSLVETALELTDNNRTGAAKLLGVTRQRLVNWLAGY